MEGKNIVIEKRETEGRRSRVPALIAELLRLKGDIIVTSPIGVRPAKKASSTIPIVMTYSADPVRQGLVASLAHPGGNVTGPSDFHADLVTKRLELLKEVVPLASRVAVLLNPDSSSSRSMLKAIQWPLYWGFLDAAVLGDETLIMQENSNYSQINAPDPVLLGADPNPIGFLLRH